MKTVVKYPSINDYQEALQHPELKFKDKRLRAGNIEKDPMGMPKVRSGGFALTYKLANSNYRWAVRCFHKPVVDREKRYSLISSFLNVNKSPILINVEYLPDEILVNGSRYPITLMDWIDGDTLSQYLYKNANKPSKLASLAESFLVVVDELERMQIAHGDLSHLNIIIKNDKMMLIDYDGLFVPSFHGWKSAELGNLNFQHPLRKAEHFDNSIDRFSEMVIYLALSGIALSPKLFNKYGAGAEGLLFKANDFIKPRESSLLRDLEAISELKPLVEKFRSVCVTEMSNIPKLRDLLGDQIIAIPQATQAILSTLEAQAYSIVFDASNKGLMLEKEGEFITVVGQVTNVYQGVAINNKPYIFLNFGDFRIGCFTIVFWSEAITLMKQVSKEPNDYMNQWVTVTGTVTTYDGRYNLRPQMVLDSPADIQIITKEEAQEKLGYGLDYMLRESPSTGDDVGQKIDSLHDHKLTELYSKPDFKTPPSKAQPTSKAVNKSKNAITQASSTQQQGDAINKNSQMSVSKKLDQLYSQGNISPTQSSKPKAVQSKPSSQKSFKPAVHMPAWVWFAITILLIFIFVSAITSNIPQTQPTSTPKPKPTATTTAVATLSLQPTLSAIQIAATENATCIEWTQVKSVDEGKLRCVYGIVVEERGITTDSDFWFLIRFDSNPATFYVVSDNLLQVKNGDCVVAKSIVNYDANGIPYMKVAEISIDDNQCSQ